MSTYKIADEQVYERDAGSKALVATDKNALLQHRKKIRDAHTILTLSRDINSMRKELDAMKEEVKLLREYGCYNCQHKG